jgi:hypothetical protein
MNIPGYIHLVVLDEGSKEPTPQQVAWGLDGNNAPARHVSAYYDGITSLAFATYSGLDKSVAYDMYIVSTNDYPGNNKQLDQNYVIARSARIDAGEECNPCDDTYLIVDEFGLAGAVLALWALFL